MDYLDATKVNRNLCLENALEDCSELMWEIEELKHKRGNCSELIEEIAELTVSLDLVKEIAKSESEWTENEFDIVCEKWIDFQKAKIEEKLCEGRFQ